MVQLLGTLVLLLVKVQSSFATSARFLPGTSPLVGWSGRTVRINNTIRFDWIGTSARVSVANASWVTVIVTTTAPKMGTRLKAYVSDQGFELYPLVSFWISPLAPSNETLLFAIDSPMPGNRTVTIENMIGASSAVGITTVHGTLCVDKIQQPRCPICHFFLQFHFSNSRTNSMKAMFHPMQSVHKSCAHNFPHPPSDF